MSYELVNRISVKGDKVYFSHHSNNDTCPFCSSEIKHLSEVYQKQGQEGLDYEIINMALDYIDFRGQHPSVQRYKNAIYLYLISRHYREHIASVNAAWHNLTEEDQKSIGYGCEPTFAAKEYLNFTEEVEREKRKKILENLPINPQTYEFDLVNIKGEKAIFFNSGMPDYLVPKGLYKYEILADVNTGLPIAATNRVGETHFFGTILLKNDIAADEASVILHEDDFNLIEPSKVTLAQYRRLVK